MTENQSKSVIGYDRFLRSSPRKLNSPAKASSPANQIKKIELRSTPTKPRKNLEKINFKIENKLSEKELSFCLDLNENSDNSDSSDEEQEKPTIIKERFLIKSLTKNEIELWRVSDSPVTKKSSPAQKNKTCEKPNSPCDRIRHMSPVKSEQLNKARRSLNLDLCTQSKNSGTVDGKSPLKLTLKRKVVDCEDNKDVSPAKICDRTTKPASKVTDKLETPPSLKNNLRSRENIKLPLWRRVDSSPLKEIQSPKTISPRTVKHQTPQKQMMEVSVSIPKLKLSKVSLTSPKPKTAEDSITTPKSKISEVSVTPKSKVSEVLITTPKSNRKVSIGTPVNYVGIRTYGTPVSKKLEGRGFLTPTMAEKQKHNQVSTPQGPLDEARVQLHISTVPKSLPCREKEFNNIHGFLKRKINDHAGGCMYISGVPGTGKTATVHTVVRSLQQLADEDEISPFDFVEVNGLRLTEPRQAYVRILQTLTGQKLTAEQAQRILDKRFSGSTKRSTVLLVDELDYLCNRRQDVVYNILDWPSKQKSGLVVLTISNTMDLPERTLKGRVTSRMGLTRLMFQPYTHHQLQEIVLNRLAGNKSFHPDAVQLVARKVAAVSGDARRALDICRRATELVSGKETVKVSHVESALTQIFTGPRVLAIRSCSKMNQLVLRALRDETQRTGVDETNVRQVYYHLFNICSLEDCPKPTVGDVLRACTALADLGLIVAEKGRPDIMRKLSLNVSSDDIHYALDC